MVIASAGIVIIVGAKTDKIEFGILFPDADPERRHLFNWCGIRKIFSLMGICTVGSICVKVLCCSIVSVRIEWSGDEYPLCHFLTFWGKFVVRRISLRKVADLVAWQAASMLDYRSVSTFWMKSMQRKSIGNCYQRGGSCLNNSINAVVFRSSKSWDLGYCWWIIREDVYCRKDLYQLTIW